MFSKIFLSLYNKLTMLINAFNAFAKVFLVCLFHTFFITVFVFSNEYILCFRPLILKFNNSFKTLNKV